MTKRRLLLVVFALAIAGVLAAILLQPEPESVWCLVSPSGSIAAIRARPGGDEILHFGTMTAGEAAWAYYYDAPMSPSGGPSISHLLATGRETTTACERWREFRRCSQEEFEVVLASWRSSLSGG